MKVHYLATVYKSMYFISNKQDILDNFRNSSGKLFACFINLADAFVSIDHDIMIERCEVHIIPMLYVIYYKTYKVNMLFRLNTVNVSRLLLGEKMVCSKETHSPL